MLKKKKAPKIGTKVARGAFCSMRAERRSVGPGSAVAPQRLVWRGGSPASRLGALCERVRTPGCPDAPLPFSPPVRAGQLWGASRQNAQSPTLLWDHTVPLAGNGALGLAWPAAGGLLAGWGRRVGKGPPAPPGWGHSLGYPGRVTIQAKGLPQMPSPGLCCPQPRAHPHGRRPAGSSAWCRELQIRRLFTGLAGDWRAKWSV